MQSFPKDKLTPLAARLYPSHGDWSLTIEFEPIDVQIDGQTCVFDNPFRGDGVELGTDDPRTLFGQSLEFPTNPTDGYIDGSVYFYHAHNPVDITCLSFLQDADGGLRLGVKSKWVMSFEHPELEDFDLNFEVPLSITES